MKKIQSLMLLVLTICFAASSVHAAPLEIARGSYVPVDVPTVDIPPVEGGGPSIIIFMNRNGGTFTCAGAQVEDSSQNFSSLACMAPGGTFTLPAFSDGDAVWDDVMTCFREIYSPFNVEVTDIDPGGTPHVESFVGGFVQAGLGGVAPFSCGLIPQAIVFTFSDVYNGNVRAICETAAQETAHAFGLDHEYLCEDPMTYLGNCGAKSFQDVDARCGTNGPENCMCGGATQNSFQRLLALFGPAPDPCMVNEDCPGGRDVCLGGQCVTGPGEPGGLGEPCMIDDNCDSGTCAASGDGSFCAALCTPGVAGFCPSGFDCVGTGGASGVCWAGGGGGCCSVAGSRRGTTAWFGLLIFALAVLATRQRRRT